MGNEQKSSTQPGDRTELLPVRQEYFHQGERDPNISRVIYALKGICDALDQEEVCGTDYEEQCKFGNLAAAASILATQLTDRLTERPSRARRRQAKLRAVPGDVQEGAT